MAQQSNILAHESWLLDRLNEAYRVDPDATFADGFDYALGFIDLGIGVGVKKEPQERAVENIPMTEESLLDKNKKYSIWTPDECFWRFEYKAHYGYGDTTWNWFAFRRRPGQMVFEPDGPRTELEVFRLLTVYGHRLDIDDLLDLGLWIKHNGLEEFMKQNRIDWELEDLNKEKEDASWGRN